MNERIIASSVRQKLRLVPVVDKEMFRKPIQRTVIPVAQVVELLVCMQHATDFLDPLDLQVECSFAKGVEDALKQGAGTVDDFTSLVTVAAFGVAVVGRGVGAQGADEGRQWHCLLAD